MTKFCHCAYCAKPFQKVLPDRRAYADFLELLIAHGMVAARKRFVAPELPSLKLVSAKPVKAKGPRPGQPLRVNDRRVG